MDLSIVDPVFFAMLTLYYSPLSPNARRVWVLLLEKQVEFELKPLSLKGDQRHPGFQSLNPFGQIPVLVDGSRTIVESLAILDYLEACYPQPCFLPSDPGVLARVRMVEQLTDNKLLYTLGSLITDRPGSEPYDRALGLVHKTLGFWENLLGHDPYFGGDTLSLGDIVAGTTFPLFQALGLGLETYSQLHHWMERLNDRPSWQTTALSVDGWREFKRRISVLVMMQKRRNQGS